MSRNKLSLTIIFILLGSLIFIGLKRYIKWLFYFSFMKRRILLFIVVILAFISLSCNKEVKCDYAYLTFTFDDGYEEMYTTVLPIFGKYNISGTSYIIVDLVGGYFEEQKLMDWNEIKKLKESGFEIGSHTLNHKNLTKLEKEEIIEELKISKEKLEEKGFNVRSLSIPYGSYNNEVKEIAKDYYDNVRASNWGINSLSDLDRYDLKTVWIVNSTNFEEMKSLVDETGEDEWIIFMVHIVRDNKSLEYIISPKDLENLIKYSKDKGIKIKTVSEVLDLRCVRNGR